MAETADHVGLADRVYDSIRRDIVSCRLAPGALIREPELARRYGVSKTPVREALFRLQTENLVKTLPRHGTVISPVTVEDIYAIYLLRFLVEPAIAALAAQRASADDIDKLRAQWFRFSEPAESSPDDDEARTEAHSQFHVNLAKCAGLDRLVPIVSSIHFEIRRFFILKSHLGLSIHSGSGDAKMLDAIAAKDPAGAQEATRQAVEKSYQGLINALFADAALPTTAPSALDFNSPAPRL